MKHIYPAAALAALAIVLGAFALASPQVTATGYNPNPWPPHPSLFVTGTVWQAAEDAGHPETSNPNGDDGHLESSEGELLLYTVPDGAWFVLTELNVYAGHHVPYSFYLPLQNTTVEVFERSAHGDAPKLRRLAPSGRNAEDDYRIAHGTDQPAVAARLPVGASFGPGTTVGIRVRGGGMLVNRGDFVGYLVRQ